MAAVVVVVMIRPFITIFFTFSCIAEGTVSNTASKVWLIMSVLKKIQILTKVQFWGLVMLLFKRNILIHHSCSLAWDCQVNLTTCA